MNFFFLLYQLPSSPQHSYIFFLSFFSCKCLPSIFLSSIFPSSWVEYERLLSVARQIHIHRPILSYFLASITHSSASDSYSYPDSDILISCEYLEHFHHVDSAWIWLSLSNNSECNKEVVKRSRYHDLQTTIFQISFWKHLPLGFQQANTSFINFILRLIHVL